MCVCVCLVLVSVVVCACRGQRGVCGRGDGVQGARALGCVLDV